jgi:peptide/nickel transport system substrate-binding protein
MRVDATRATGLVLSGLVVLAALPSASGGAGGGPTIRVLRSQDLRSLDPQVADRYGSPGSDPGWQVLYATCALLLMYPDEPAPARGRVIPEAAESLPKVRDGGRTYVFTVRRGLRFADGKPLTAANFKAALDRARNPELKSYARLVFHDVRSVVARGRRLTIRLARPNGDLPSRVATPYACPIPTDLPADPAGVPFVPGSGPYTVTNFEPGRGFTLVRNRRYRGSRPRVPSRIVVTIGGDPRSNLARVEAGEAELLWEAVPREAHARLVARYGLDRSQLRRQSSMTVAGFLYLNPRSQLLRANARLRRAINFAVDRRELARIGFGGALLARRTDQGVPITAPGFRDVRLYPLKGPNLAAARRLARRALRGRKAILLAVPGVVGRELSEALAFQLGKIGLEVDTRALSLPAIGEALTTPGEPWDISLATWWEDFPDPAAFVLDVYGGPRVHGRRPGLVGPNVRGIATGNAWPQLDDPALNRKLIAAMRLEGAARWRRVTEIDAAVLRDEAPIVPLYDPVFVYFVGPRLGCLRPHVLVDYSLNSLCLTR